LLSACLGYIIPNPTLDIHPKLLMMSGDQFYVTLPSNIEKDDTASNFRVKIPNHIKLDGEWEVGLAEIIYMYSWINLSSTNYDNFIQVKISNVPEHKKHHDLMYIEPSHYESINELLNSINNQIKKREYFKIDCRLLIQFRYDNLSRLVTLTVDPDYID